MKTDDSLTLSSLETLQRLGLLSASEVDEVRALGTDARFGPVVDLAKTLHVHSKVDDTAQLPGGSFLEAGAALDHEKEGFVKFRFPGGLNAIFSHIQVSEEELVETAANRRPRPFLDHIGVDLRDETDETRAAFDGLPALADQLGMPSATQGGAGQPVRCCHVEVAAKHWLFQPEREGRPGIPLEFAYGALAMNPDGRGCDLRPADPQRVDPASIPSCCAGEPGATEAAGGTQGGSPSYYQRADLGRFGEIGRSNPELGAAFFDYYGKVMGPGRLSAREKSLIGLAVAHALKCPYCIDSLSARCLGQGLDEAEMMEAVQVAGALAAGVTLVHATQTLGHVDRARSSH